MIITDLKIYSYELSLKTPLHLAGSIMSSRPGLLVRVETKSAHAWGEAAPLIGFSVESQDQVQSELLSVRDQLIGQSLTSELLELEGGFDQLLAEHTLSASARCALEMAVINLLRLQQTSAEKLSVRVNCLLPRSVDHSCDTVESLLAQGYSTIKLKVGGESVAEEVAKVNTLATQIAGRARLRIDVNRTWSFDEAMYFLDATKDAAIEYIEEPVASYDELLNLLGEAGMAERIALDESLTLMTPEDLRSFPAIAAVILKPTLMGGLERATAFAQVAAERGTQAVISSSFESSVGLESLAWLAGRLTGDVSHGLATASFFERDILKPPPAVVGGNLTFLSSPVQDSDLDSSLLSEVTGV